MTTQTAPRSTGLVEVNRFRGRIRALTTTVVILAMALIGLGAWMIFGSSGLNGDIQPLVDDYMASWNNYDGEAFLALVTDDFTFDDGSGPVSATREASVIDMLGTYNFKVEQVGDPTMVGDGSAYVVALPETVTGTGGPADGVSVLTIVERDGTYLVRSHVFTEAIP